MSEGKGLLCGHELCCATWPQDQSVFLSLFYLVVQNEVFENHRGQTTYQKTGKKKGIIVILLKQGKDQSTSVPGKNPEQINGCTMYKDLKGNKKINSLLGFITTRLNYTNLASVYTKIL